MDINLTESISAKLMGYKGGDIDSKSIAESAHSFTYVFSVLQEAIIEISNYLKDKNSDTSKIEEDTYRIINASVKELQENTQIGDMVSYEMVLIPKNKDNKTFIN